MEKAPDNISPKPDEKLITPELVEEGLRNMREKAAEKATDEFDALRARRDFLDKRFFKRERKRTKKKFSDSPDQERSEIENLHHERFLQAGAKLFRVTEDVARSNIFIDGEGICKEVKKRFQKDKLPMSKDQDVMLSYAAKIWDENKKVVLDYLKDLFQNYRKILINALGQKKEFAFDKFADCRGKADLQNMNDYINQDKYLKGKIISDLGYLIEFAGPKYGLSQEEVDHNLDLIAIDFCSYHPFVLIKVKDREFWERNAGAGTEAFYFPGGEFGSMGIYIFDKENEKENLKSAEHEFQHGIRYRFFNKIKNKIISEKTALSKKDVLESLKEIEHRLGALYDAREYSEKIANKSRGFSSDYSDRETDNVREKIEEHIGMAGNKDRDFWHSAQNEFCSYLERDKSNVWFGYFPSFVTEQIYKDIREKKLVSKEALMDFDVLHDMVVFYGNAGFSYEEIADVIRTSKDFKTAQKRIEQNFRLSKEKVRNAIAPEKKLAYRNLMKVLDIVEKYGQLEYFFEQMDEQRKGDIITYLLIGIESKKVLGKEITEQSQLNNEENAQIALERIIDLFVKNDVMGKQLNKSMQLASKTVRLVGSIAEYSRGILRLRLELLKKLDIYPKVIQRVILRRLSKRVNKDLFDKEAAKEVDYSINNELKSLEELRGLGDMKESWLFNVSEDESNDGILDKWLNLSEKKRRDFIDGIKEALEKEPSAPVYVLFHLMRLMEGQDERD